MNPRSIWTLSRRAIPALALVATTAAAQTLYPLQNAKGPLPPYRQDAFPYAGQCTSNPGGNSFPGAPPSCADMAKATGDAAYLGIPPAPRFDCADQKCLTPLDPSRQPKWQWTMPNPVDYQPDQGSYPGGDYYELQIAAVKGVQKLADAGIFPNPKNWPTTGASPGAAIPDGSQWTGLVDPATKAPLYTKVWGFGQTNISPGNPLYVLNGRVTWPAMNLHGTRGRPMLVKFTNALPDQHLLCPYPLAWDWPCAIDRTLMGLKSVIDPAKASTMSGVPYDRVNRFGSPQQPDNAFTIHLHGGEIPPQSDGFAEKWFGNASSGAAYAPTPQYLDPLFEAPFGTIGAIQRPGGNGPFHGSDHMTYYYPMVNEESTIWYHDHALGKTRINVVAGPAGFAPVTDPDNDTNPNLAWTRTLKNAGQELYVAIQDRSFNGDGSIAFPTGLGQPVPVPPKGFITPGMTSVTPGNNPQVHPQWFGEYFADHVTVNGVIWPRVNVYPGTYRIRLLDGSNARCYQLGMGTVEPVYATAQAPGNVTRNVSFTVIADEQGYLKAPVVIPANGFLQMCPGERYEVVVDFSAMAPGTRVFINNTAPAPFPVGINPQQKGSIFAQTASILRFDVVAPPAGVTPAKVTLPAALNNIPAPASFNVAAERQLYLNERIDPVTLTSLGLQINGVPFEYKVTETPKVGTYEKWHIINATGDFHPMHLHLVKFQVVQRQAYSQSGYLSQLCGSNKCTVFGGGAGGALQVVPDVTPFLGLQITPPAPEEAGWKDTVQAPPGVVTTVIAKWDGSWKGAHGECPMNFPGASAYGGTEAPLLTPASSFCFEPVTNAPYVWHCHIVDHEDAEMMRSTLVVK